MENPLIVLEFNELCPALMDKFIERGLLPNFEKLRNGSHVFTTDAAEKAPNLEPWIQWVTVHTGLGFEEHGVFDLDDGADLDAPRLWDFVSDAGGKVWVCGSMNPGYRPGLKGAVLPDPWSTKAVAYPEGKFDTYYHYIRKNVQEHTRDKVPLSKGDHLRFLWYMLTHGLSWRTISRTIAQLRSERGGKWRWKRASIMDHMQWDLFQDHWKRERPKYATFFLNSTAHFQHTYWRNMDPSPFEIKPTAEEQAEYEGAIQFGYQQMDSLVGECLKLAGNDTTVVLCTALSQQPCVGWEQKGGKVIHRPQDTDELLRWAGVTGPWHQAPVMAEQFHLYFPTEEAAAEASKVLESIHIDGQRVMMARPDGKDVFAGCQIFNKPPADARMKCEETGAEGRFLDLFYQISGMKSGMHHPDGIFWIHKPGQAPKRANDKMPLRQVAPTLLGLVGVPMPERAKAPVPAGSRS